MNSHQRRLERRFADRFARSPKGAAVIKAIDEFIDHCKNTRREMIRHYTPMMPLKHIDLHIDPDHPLSCRPVSSSRHAGK